MDYVSHSFKNVSVLLGFLASATDTKLETGEATYQGPENALSFHIDFRLAARENIEETAAGITALLKEANAEVTARPDFSIEDNGSIRAVSAWSDAQFFHNGSPNMSIALRPDQLEHVINFLKTCKLQLV